MVPGFWAAVFKLNVKRVRCPHCGVKQFVIRRPFPFADNCKRCHRIFEVVEGWGTRKIGAD